MKIRDTRSTLSFILFRLFGAIGYGFIGFSILLIIYYSAADDSFAKTRILFGFIGLFLGIMVILQIQSNCSIRSISVIKLLLSSFLGCLVGVTLSVLFVGLSGGLSFSIALSEGLGAGSVLGILQASAILMLRNSFMLFFDLINHNKKLKKF